MNYPIICLKPNDSNVYWFRNERSLKTADRQLTLDGVFDNLSIIDSIGKCYLVKKVTIIGWANMFWGYSIKRAGRLVRIDFDLENIGSISLPQLKQKLSDKIRNKNLTKKEIELHFENATSILELVNFFK